MTTPKRKPGRPADKARATAIATQAIRYQGAPCRKGHNGTRYASTGACVACYAPAVAPVAPVGEFEGMFS